MDSVSPGREPVMIIIGNKSTSMSVSACQIAQRMQETCSQRVVVVASDSSVSGPNSVIREAVIEAAEEYNRESRRACIYGYSKSWRNNRYPKSR